MFAAPTARAAVERRGRVRLGPGVRSLARNGSDALDKVAIITGGAAGIGFAVGERLRKAGARIAIWDLDAARAEEAARALGGKDAAIAVQTDVADWASVERSAEQTVERLGGVNILVNNAGVTGPSVPLSEYDVHQWRRVLDVNLVGMFYVCRAVVPLMLPGGWGRIVNVSSVAGKEGNPRMSAYSAAKAGVIGLTKSLAKELATSGVLVNCLTPATVVTGILQELSPETVEYMRSRIPMGRFGTVEENAAMVAFMCSEECSFSTGAVFDTSGGRCTY
ncbi:MAG: SDR family oxidoreductase [Hyphomonadaceae bacterium]|nr:SDR family oxidoreductase [Hyphomonadaceae bacterium]